MLLITKVLIYNGFSTTRLTGCRQSDGLPTTLVYAQRLSSIFLMSFIDTAK